MMLIEMLVLLVLISTFGLLPTLIGIVAATIVVMFATY